MLIKNSNIVTKFLSSSYKSKALYFNLSIQNLIISKNLKIYNFKNYCIYTHRFRSVFSSFKMSRYKMKEFLDNRTFSNIYVK